MAWPLSQDYNEAIQDPQSSLADPELRGGEATTNALGMPMPRSGNFADVYEFNCPATKSKWALKCFTRHVPGLSERYSVISRALQETRLPFAVEFQYLEQGIRVRGEWYPILKMRWVEGQLLNEIVRDNLDKPAIFNQLAQIWVRMGKRLRETGIAHADLQHGNVLFVPGSQKSSLAVKLIDYDGMFVPALAQSKSGEVGHPNYQHPQRLREAIFNAEVDRFPLLVVATALRALSVGGKSLWERYDNGDNLLFRETDLRVSKESALFKELQAIADPQTRMLVEELRKASERQLEEVPAIDELLPEAKSTAVRTAAAPPPSRPVVVDSAPVIAPPAPSTELTARVPAAKNHLDFDDEEAPVTSRRRDRKLTKENGKPKWVWPAVGGGAALAAVGIMIALAVGGKDKDKDKDKEPSNPAVVQNTPKDKGNKPEPIKSEPIKPNPIKPDPIKPDPIKPDPIKPDPIKPDPVPVVAATPSEPFFVLPGTPEWLVRCNSKDNSWGVYEQMTAQPTPTFSFRGHTAPVTCVAVSADRKRAISGAKDGTLRVWDVKTGKVLFNANCGGVTPLVVDISADGSRVVITDGSKNAYLWVAEVGKTVRSLTTSNDVVTSVAIAPDGKTVLIASGKGMPPQAEHAAHLLDFDSSEKLAGLGAGPTPITAAAFSPDGDQVSFAQGIFVYNCRGVSTRKQYPRSTFPNPYPQAVQHLSYSPSGQRLLADVGKQLIGYNTLAPGTVFNHNSAGVQASGCFRKDGKEVLIAVRDGEDRLSSQTVRSFDAGETVVKNPDPLSKPSATNSLGIQFARLQKGTFYMGGGGGKSGTKKDITDDFEIAVHTVTQDQWQTVIGSNPSSFSRKGADSDKVKDISDADLKQFPVEFVSWDDIQEFIKKLNERESGKGWTYRLPTEAEWEYACRGAATAEADCSFHFYLDKPSNDLSSEQANFNGNSPFGNAPKGKYLQRPTKVGSYMPNRLGLYDMHGNVFQWCQDISLHSSPIPRRVFRGSSWSVGGLVLKASMRYGSAISDRINTLGFRLARTPSGSIVKVPVPDPLPVVPEGIGEMTLTFMNGGQPFVAYSRPGEKSWRIVDADNKVIRTFDGHEAGLTCATISQDRQRALTASHDKTVRLWDMSTGKELQVLKGLANPVQALAFSPDNKKVLTADGSPIARLWDLDNGKELAQLANPKPVVCLAYSPTGEEAACGTDPDLYLWNLNPVKKGQLYALGELPLSVAYSPNGAHLVGMKGGNLFHVDFSRKGARTTGVGIKAVRAGVSEDGGLLLLESKTHLKVLTFPAMKEHSQIAVPQEPGWGPLTACVDSKANSVVIANRMPDGSIKFGTLKLPPTMGAMVDPPVVGGDDRKAAEWVLSIGGKVTIVSANKTLQVAAVKELPAGAWSIALISLSNNRQVTDASLTQIKALTNLRQLWLSGTPVSDAGMAHLEALTNLVMLELRSTQVSDAGLEHLKPLTKLTSLALDNTKVSDAGLGHLKTLTNLTFLQLLNTKVSDAGLIHLKTMTKLTNLNLYGTKVSDAGLANLKTLTNLTLLNLNSTDVTAAGVDALSKALPKCKIYSNFSPK